MSKASLGYKGHLRPEQFSFKKKSKTEAGNVAQVKGLPSECIASGLYKGGVPKRRVVWGDISPLLSYLLPYPGTMSNAKWLRVACTVSLVYLLSLFVSCVSVYGANLPTWELWSRCGK